MPDDLTPRGYYEGLTSRSLMAGWARHEAPPGVVPAATCADRRTG